MITLTRPQYDIVWDDLGLGQQPFPLAVRPHGRTMQERALIRNRVYGELTARRLADGPKPEPDLVGALTLLAGATASVDMTWLPGPDAAAMCNALAVAHGDHGLIAELTHEGLNLQPVPVHAVVPALLELLPPAPAAPGRSITVPVEALAPTEHAIADLSYRNHSSHRSHPNHPSDQGYPMHPNYQSRCGLRPPSHPTDPNQRSGPSHLSVYQAAPAGAGPTPTAHQVRALQSLFAKPRLRGGQVVANVRDAQNRRHRSRPLEWFDTDDGRCMAQTGAATDGRQHLLVAPADLTRIARRVHEMLDALRPFE